MNQIVRQISKEISGDRAMTDVMKIASFHRIQCSTGYRKAAEYCAETLQRQGLDCKILSYPFDGKRWYWTYKSFMEWDCKGAQCRMTWPEDRVLADFDANNIAVIQKSFPCDLRGKPVDLVMLDKGCDEDAYGDLDLNGKIIFVRDAFNGYVDWAIKKRGALGIVTDFMRELPDDLRNRYDLIDTINYTSFWWKDEETEPHTFGFVMSPRKGDALAKVCRAVAKAHAEDPSKPAYPQVECFIDSALYPGHVEAVETVIPGETEEEILLIAHLCHPRASANDNASGVASTMEVLRTLKSMLDRGVIAPLKRGIRAVFIPEFSGAYAYLCENEKILPNIVAGMNLDMVGGRQGKGYGPLAISATPHATPSCTAAVSSVILDEIKLDRHAHVKDNYVPMFNALVGRFTAGSDHYILSDPTVGIPTLMLGQWPDVNYHTSSDTVDCVDPFMLQKSASIAAGYAYTLSNFSDADVLPVLLRMREMMQNDIGKIASKCSEGELSALEAKTQIGYYETYYLGCAADVAKFAPKSENLSVLIERTQKQMKTITTQVAEEIDMVATKADPAPEAVDPKYNYVPRRVARGPLVHVDDYAVGNPELQAQYQAYMSGERTTLVSGHTFEAMVQYYMDGKRTLAEVAKMAMFESHEGSVELTHTFVSLLKAYGVVVVDG